MTCKVYVAYVALEDGLERVRKTVYDGIAKAERKQGYERIRALFRILIRMP
jgi:hypothetical protein